MHIFQMDQWTIEHLCEIVQASCEHFLPIHQQTIGHILCIQGYDPVGARTRHRLNYLSAFGHV